MLCAVGLAARPSTKLASASANASPSTPNGWFDAQMLPTIPCGLSDMGPRMRSSLLAHHLLSRVRASVFGIQFVNKGLAVQVDKSRCLGKLTAAVLRPTLLGPSVPKVRT